MDTAQNFIQHLRNQQDDPRALGVFDQFRDRTTGHEVVSRDPSGFRCISRLEFRDSSHVEIVLTSSEDHLAFAANGRFQEGEFIVFHPEGVGAGLFEMVNQLQIGLALETPPETPPETPAEQPDGKFKLSPDARDRAIDWLLEGETGLSSQAILRAALYGEVRAAAAGTAQALHGAAAHPLDGADLRRCILMLERIPEARRGVNILARHSVHWRRLAPHWDELEQKLRSEWHNQNLTEPALQKAATRTYRLIREILDGRRDGEPGTLHPEGE